MKTLKEKKIIVRMQTALGEAVDPALLEEIAQEEAKIEAENQSRKNAFQNIFTDLSQQLSQLMAEEKKKTEEEQALLDRFANVLTRIDEIKAAQPVQPIVVEEQQVEEIVEELIPSIEEVEEVVEASAILAPIEEPSLAKEAAKKIKKKDQPPSMFVQPAPEVTGRDLQEIQRKLKLLEGWVGKISMTGPGGGAVWLRDLDDVAHYPVKNALNGHAFVYNGITKKWEPHFLITTGDTAPAYPNNGDVWYNTTDAHTYIWLVENDIGQWVDIIGGSTNIVTTTVTTSTYTVGIVDNYVGVNFAGPVTITLPAVAASGRTLIIKDESGRCSFNHITLAGNIDNDPGGAILQVDNGAIQMVYRAGWRIV